jgi:hypothetical protein
VFTPPPLISEVPPPPPDEITVMPEKELKLASVKAGSMFVNV